MARVSSSTPPVSPYGPAAPDPATPGPAAPGPGPIPPAGLGHVGYTHPQLEHRWGDAARDAWSVNVRCQAILVVLALLASAAWILSGDALETTQIMAFVWVVHAVVTLVVGYPVGVLAGRILPAAPSRGAAAGGFVLAGGVAGALAMLWAGPVAALAWGALGAATAGGARAWAHGTVERRRMRGATPQVVVSPTGWAPGPSVGV